MQEVTSIHGIDYTDTLGRENNCYLNASLKILNVVTKLVGSSNSITLEASTQYLKIIFLISFFLIYSSK